MIRIEIETMKTAVSELQRKRAILSNIKERMAKLAYAVSQQSYVEETVCELRKLKKRMGEIEATARWSNLPLDKGPLHKQRDLDMTRWTDCRAECGHSAKNC